MVSEKDHFPRIEQVIFEPDSIADAAYGSEARMEVEDGGDRLADRDPPMTRERCLVGDRRRERALAKTSEVVADATKSRKSGWRMATSLDRRQPPTSHSVEGGSSDVNDGARRLVSTPPVTIGQGPPQFARRVVSG